MANPNSLARFSSLQVTVAVNETLDRGGKRCVQLPGPLASVTSKGSELPGSGLALACTGSSYAARWWSLVISLECPGCSLTARALEPAQL